RLSQLPGYGRLFVGIVTTLMLGVVLWAVWIYTVRKGTVNPNDLPAYLSQAQRQTILRQEAGHEPTVEKEKPSLSRNLGLAHVHINGQTLLFFALGSVFLFTSVPPQRKKLVYVVFALSIVLHAIGLSGEGFHWFFDDLLALSGIVMLVVMLYMSFFIYVDLGRKPRGEHS
ncbi:MAG: hypothetical protein D6800_04260, partial [Candidatus Zixiibacteriota bacterium]